MCAWYANPDPIYQPAMRLVTGISKAKNAVITTNIDHDYRTGLIIRIYVPNYYGMFQINGMYGPVTALTNDTFSVEIDTTTYDSFLAPASPADYRQTALCIPIGNISDSYNLAVKNVT
jgi:hypothetical protein